jgi:hypothetical protein
MHFPGSDGQVTCTLCESVLKGHPHKAAASAMGYPADPYESVEWEWKGSFLLSPMTQLGMAIAGSVVAFAVARPMSMSIFNP